MAFSEKKIQQLESKIMSYRYRNKDADQRKTYDEVFDEKTLLSLYKLMTNNVFDTLDFPLATGKEGNVFRATTIDGKLLAVKIYRVSNSTFKNIQKYITGDRRFRGVGKNHRRGIYMWAQKEYRNLERMHNNGISVPKPVVCENNVVVMEYIGTEKQPAKHLKDVILDNPQDVFDNVIGQMKIMYQKAELVHADLSEYNILMTDTLPGTVQEDDAHPAMEQSPTVVTTSVPMSMIQTPIIIDVGQAVLTNHPMAQEFLVRDIKNIIHFFNKHGVEADHTEIIEMIRGDVK